MGPPQCKPAMFSKTPKTPKYQGPQQPYFVVHFSPQNKPTIRAKRFSVDTRMHLFAFRTKIQHLWAMREKGDLWWSASAHGEVSSEKSVIRTWCTRRVRTAFRDALRAHGYDDCGRRMPDIERKDGVPQSQLEVLKGSLELHVRLAVKEAKYTDLVRQSERVVESIEQYLIRLR
ncbi:hypothetical protein PABG_06516 [Paracoccidioides brasiliensis Pb03]|uniref:Uncharacterized protein n=1 Tax=Paracoccidioides brasiliensis TaxID=121759 RepID=A0A1D2JIU6_PARBR|nr:hypothetical protein PABG_06516 [Paracoccidioides brasiliensis Pb03]ODH38354.1 hypothetical protein ACO22_02400 [Paracoccidioides brasiliensis]